MKATIRSNAE